MGQDLRREEGRVTVKGGLGPGHGHRERLAPDLKGQETPIVMTSADFII